MNWHGTIVILQWLLFAAGVVALLRRSGWSPGLVLMAGSLLFQAVGGLVSLFAADAISRHQAIWIPMLAWTVSTVAFAAGFLFVCLGRKDADPATRANAAQRPS